MWTPGHQQINMSNTIIFYFQYTAASHHHQLNSFFKVKNIPFTFTEANVAKAGYDNGEDGEGEE